MAKVERDRKAPQERKKGEEKMKKEKKDVDMELLRRIEELEEENKRLRNKDIQEVENPYTVTNRVVDELVTPQDTMYYLTGGTG